MTYKVLIVDDAGYVREILSNMITQSGHSVVGEATNGAEAVTKAFSLKPDLIFMDLVLPEKNGIDAIIEILEIKSNCKIIAISTLDEEFVIQKAMQAGCVAYLKKPFSKQDVQKIFDQVDQRLTEARHG